DRPPVADEELTISMEEAWKVAERTGEDACEIFIPSAEADYLARYSEFAKWLKQPGMRLQWLLAADRISVIGCYVRAIEREIYVSPEDAGSDEPIYFCGNISRKALNPREARSIEAYLFLLSEIQP